MRWKNIIDNPLVDGAQYAPIRKNIAPLAAGAVSTMAGIIADKAFESLGFWERGSSQLRANAETNQWNYQMWLEQQQFAKEQYERELLENRADALKERNWALSDRDYENWYNSPSEQIKRYRQAGLNPFLMMDNSAPVGSVNVNNPSTSAPHGSIPSAPTMVAPNLPSQPYSNPFGALASMMTDLAFRQNQNDLEWFKAVSQSDLDPETKNWMLKNKMFKGDRNTDLNWRIKDQMFHGLVYDNVMKEVDTLFKQEMNDHQRKEFAHQEKMYPKLLQEIEAQISNLNKQGDLYDKDGKLKDKALEVIESQIKEMSRYEDSMPEWAKTFVSVLDRVFGGSLGRVLQLLK